MKHYPKSLISFRKLQGGQFGTLDVSAISPDYVQLALGTDFIQLTRAQWIALRSAGDRFFHSEAERAILTRDDGEPVLFEETETVNLEDETREAIYVEDEPAVRPVPPRAAKARPRQNGRRREGVAG